MIQTKELDICMNALVDAAKNVLPPIANFKDPILSSSPVQQLEYSALVGLTGSAKGRLVLEASQEIVSQLAETMYGMAMEGEMLASFFGEVANMVAGNMASKAAKHKVKLDIAPPTVVVGQSVMYGFKQAIKTPIAFGDSSDMSMILSLES